MSPNTPFYFPNLSSLHIDQCFTVGQLAVGFLYSHINPLSRSLSLSDPDCHLMAKRAMALMHLNVAKKKGSQALLHSSDSFFSFNFNFYFKRSNKYGQLTIILRNHINDLQNVCASCNCRALSFDSISESLERPLMGLNCCCFYSSLLFSGLHSFTFWPGTPIWFKSNAKSMHECWYTRIYKYMERCWVFYIE